MTLSKLIDNKDTATSPSLTDSGKGVDNLSQHHIKLAKHKDDRSTQNSNFCNMSEKSDNDEGTSIIRGTTTGDTTKDTSTPITLDGTMASKTTFDTDKPDDKEAQDPKMLTPASTPNKRQLSDDGIEGGSASKKSKDATTTMDVETPTTDPVNLFPSDEEGILSTLKINLCEQKSQE